MAYSLKIRLDWSELDHFGHINNVHYYKFIQSSRVNFWEQTGIYEYYKTSLLGPILANASCNFLKPLHYPGNVTIVADVVFVKNSSFSLRHRMYNDDNELVAEGSDVMVFFDYNENHSIVVPEWLREQLIPHIIETNPSL